MRSTHRRPKRDRRIGYGVDVGAGCAAKLAVEQIHRVMNASFRLDDLERSDVESLLIAEDGQNDPGDDSEERERNHQLHQGDAPPAAKEGHRSSRAVAGNGSAKA